MELFIPTILLAHDVTDINCFNIGFIRILLVLNKGQLQIPQAILGLLWKLVINHGISWAPFLCLIDDVLKMADQNLVYGIDVHSRSLTAFPAEENRTIFLIASYTLKNDSKVSILSSSISIHVYTGWDCFRFFSSRLMIDGRESMAMAIISTKRLGKFSIWTPIHK